MKTRILLLLFFLSFALFFSQSDCNHLNYNTCEESCKNSDKKEKCCKKAIKTNIVQYDFRAGEYINADVRPQHGKNIVFRIVNINPFSNIISTTPHDIEFDSNVLPETPKPSSTNEIENNEIPEKEGEVAIEQSKQETIIAKEKSITSEVSKEIIQVSDNEIEQLKENKKNLDKKINDLISLIKSNEDKVEEIKNKNLISKTDSLNKLNFSDKNIELSSIKENLISEQTKLSQQIDDIEKENEKTGKLVKTINVILDEINKNYNDFYKYSALLFKLNENYQNFLDKINDPTLNFDEYKKMKEGSDIEKISILEKEKFSEKYGWVNAYEESLKNAKNILEDYKLKQTLRLLKEINGGKDIAKDIEEGLLSKKESIDEINSKISQLEIRRKLNYVEMVNRKLSDSCNYVHTSEPIQPRGDILEFEVKVENRKSLHDNYFLPNKSKSFKYSEYVRGGIRFDFSLGTVFDFVNNNQTYEVINIKKDENSSGYEIRQISDNKYVPIIATMLHTSLRSSKLSSVAFTFGLALDPSKLQIDSLFPGISLMLGKKDKIVFTAGPSFRKVEELNDAKYTLNTYIDDVPNDFLIDSFKVGFFVGVSWSLTNKQRNIISMEKQ